MVFEIIANLGKETYFGNTIAQYIAVFVVLLITFVAAKILYYITKNYVRVITKKSKTKMDDILLEIIEKPMVLLLLVFGLWLSVALLTLSEKASFFVNNIIVILVTMTVAFFFYRLSDIIIGEYLTPMVSQSKSKLDDQLVPVLRKGVKIFIVILTFIIIINNFGYSVTSLLAGLGIGGIALALAAQDSLGNLMGSVAIFTDKPFEVQDKVKIGDTSGIVQEVGLRSTRIKTYDGTQVTIPNAYTAKSIVENVSKAEAKKINVTIGLTYNTPAEKLGKAIQIIKDILKNHKKVQEANHVFFENFGAYSLDIKVIYWIDSKDFAERNQVLHEINTEILKTFNKNKLEFAFPTQSIYLEK